MPGFIDVSIVGDAAGVQAMLLHLETKLAPPNMAAFLLGNVDPFLKTRASARFSGEGDDVVGAWSPLQPATQAIRSAQGYGAEHPINQRTGQLENYITSGGSVTVTPLGSTLTFPGTPAQGELAEKVATAQSGRAVPSTVPRPVLGLNERDLAAVMTMLALDLQKP